jgi:thiamine biosynthesis lipoprotein
MSFRQTGPNNPARFNQLRRFVANGAAMGTRYSAIFYAPDTTEPAAIEVSLQTAVEQVDRQMSNWKPDSDISRFNDASTGVWITMPKSVLFVVMAGLQVSALSAQAFDVALGDCIQRWGFGPDPRDHIIAPDAPRFVTADHLDIEYSTSRMRKSAHIHLDLCGIAKGFAVDQMAVCLDRQGIDNYLVAIDGEMRTRGSAADGKPFVIGVEKPDRFSRDIDCMLEVENVAIATSGNYRHWRETDGGLISHTIDPRTGDPVTNAVCGVTVIAETAMEADAWATALMVTGEEKGPVLAEQNGLDALFFLRGKHAIDRVGTGQFAGEL